MLTIAVDGQDRLCRYGDFQYVYDDNGRLATKTEISTSDVTTYTYDGLGRLRTVELPSGVQIDYVLDALGRRIGKAVNGNLVKGWLYGRDSLRPLAQFNSAGQVEMTFVYETRVNVPDYIVKADGTVLRVVTDHLGSVRLVVNVSTGAVVQRMDYDEFGNVLVDTNPGWQPFGFAGGLYDADTGLVRFGARDYDAVTGRWTATDPELFDDGTNLYAYVGNDPVNFIDPEGTNRFKLIGDLLRRGGAAAKKLWNDLNFDGPAQRLWDHGHGRICQVRYKKDKLKLRLDYDPLQPGGDPRLHLNVEFGGKDIHVPLDPRIFGD